MTTRVAAAYSLKDPARRIELADLAAEQRRNQHKYVAAAGIGQPDRFFDMLARVGLEISAIGLNDHYDFAHNPFVDTTLRSRADHREGRRKMRRQSNAGQ